jgi:ribosome-interacting GTPase 1
MLDVTKGDEQRQQLEHELEEIGIRLNRQPPDVVFKQKTAGGITINCTVPLTKTDERTVRGILQAYKVSSVVGVFQLPDLPGVGGSLTSFPSWADPQRRCHDP